jgi:hypothetical protein
MDTLAAVRSSVVPRSGSRKPKSPVLPRLLLIGLRNRLRLVSAWTETACAGGSRSWGRLIRESERGIRVERLA